MLYPQESETREVKDLSGIWSFKLDPDERGHREAWQSSPLADAIPMPVPASYNDITCEATMRDHIGEVWYERSFFLPERWRDRRVCIRFSSADHCAIVWVNGQEVARHRGGFLPFEADIGSVANFGGDNRVTVAVSNVLSWDMLPSGFVRHYDDGNHPPGYRSQEILFDFFNYAGLNRPVALTASAATYLRDITVRTDWQGDTGFIEYELAIGGGQASAAIRLLDEAGAEVATATGERGALTVPQVRLWQPGAAYLYTAEIALRSGDGALIDLYRLPIGIRTIEVVGDEFRINGVPFRFQGCCKHEDMDVKGRGFDAAMLVKDFTLLSWLGANSFRTSHYPYAEEVLQLADRAGIVVIDEAPAVGMRSEDPSQPTYSEERISSRTLAHHKSVIEELIQRDKNHPCVVMWCVANEPIVDEPAAGEYFGEVIAATRQLDPTRPVTLVMGDVVKPEHCYPFAHVDVLCINRYHSWYSDPGHIELIERQLIHELTPWHTYFSKPMIVSEYGADTIAGLHALPSTMFTEEYQRELLEAFHRGFDQLPFIIGEHVWNFADFATKQGVRRVVGNRKGVFTRQRQPKAAAFALRERWKKKR